MVLLRIVFLSFVAALLHGADDADWIRGLGGRVEHDPAGHIIAVNLTGTWVNDAEMLDLAALAKLERLDLSHTRISDEGLLRLRPARQIRELNLLYAEQITDLGLNAINDWQNLRRLNLRGTRVSDAALAIVGKLPQIESLDIANTGVTENGLDSLVPLTRLKHLAIGRGRFSDGALAMLRLLSTLESLDLSGPRGVARNQRGDGGAVPRELVRAIAELKELRHLKLGHVQIAADELRDLAVALPNLEKLGLEACARVDDQVIDILAEWKSLKYLDVQETKVTRNGVETLQKRRPELRILSGPFTPPNTKG